MKDLVGVYISKRKRLKPSYESKMIFNSGREWPKYICGKFIVRKATEIGLLWIDDKNGEWVVSVDALAPEINPLIQSDKMKQLPITPENEQLVFEE